MMTTTTTWLVHRSCSVTMDFSRVRSVPCVPLLARAGVLAAALDKALAWFLEHRISTLEDKTAAELVAEERAEHVQKYIEMLSAGSTG